MAPASTGTPRQRRRIKPKNDQGAAREASPRTPGAKRPPVSPASGSTRLREDDKLDSWVNVSLMVSFFTPLLHKDGQMQLLSLYEKLRNKEIILNDFLRMVGDMVGESRFNWVVNRVQRQMAQSQSAKNPGSNSIEIKPQSQSSSKELLFSPSNGQESFNDDTMDQSQTLATKVELKTDDSTATQENNFPKSNEMVSQSETQSLCPRQVTVDQEKDLSMTPSQENNQQQQQHFELPSTSIPTKEGIGVHNHTSEAYTGAYATSRRVSQSEAQSLCLRQVTVDQGKDLIMPSPSQAKNKQQQHFQLLSTSLSMKEGIGVRNHIFQAYTGAYATSCRASLDAQDHNSRLDTVSNSQGMCSSQIQMGSEIPSATAPDVKTSADLPFVNMKKRSDSVGASSAPLSKKQKVSGAPLDQSIVQLTDVIALSGVCLQEEEEQLYASFRNESHALEATRRVVQEEQMLILEKEPLQKKLGDIMTKFGLERTISSDVECCLSLCVEERLHRLISNIIRQSKQRVDMEKLGHGNSILWTSDIRRQIMIMNRKTKEDWDKRRADEAEKQHRLNETEKAQGSETLKGKVEGRLKSLKASKEEGDNMGKAAANFAARVAVGGDDLLAKWKLMAEQARQTRYRGIDDILLSDSLVSEEGVGGRPLSASANSRRGDDQDIGSRGPSAEATAGVIKNFGRSFPAVFPTKIRRTISVNDVITVLEREPQMSKSALLYRLYEQIHSTKDT